MAKMELGLKSTNDMETMRKAQELRYKLRMVSNPQFMMSVEDKVIECMEK